MSYQAGNPTSQLENQSLPNFNNATLLRFCSILGTISEALSKLYSKNAKVDKEAQIMAAYNDVHLVSSDNKRLETEELMWDQASDRVFTEKDVKIITNKEIIYGKGFYANSDFTKYEVTNIKGTFDINNQIE